MPIRARKSRRRLDAAPAWACAFECEFDYFDDLPEIGVHTDSYGLPDREEAEAAWHRYGAAFMAEWRARPHHPDDLDPWAFTAFGEPRRR